jgi:transaldolase
MAAEKIKTAIHNEIEQFVKRDFSPRFDLLKETFKTEPVWRRLREIGTELWLDSGNIDDIEKLWTREFSAVTVNNTLLNKEVQTGRYDSLIPEAVKILSAYPELSRHQKILEIAFILNAWHGLRLVEKFDAYVSVEEHTDLAHDVELAVDYARRFHAICPQRFFIKIPLTPAGLLATRRLSTEGVPVNHTLGFSARQNYIIARIAKPAFVNVFLGRLNSFVVDNQLGDGKYVGEKATLASQAALEKLRQTYRIPSRQIGASFRQYSQVQDLAGIDVMTMPPKVADEFLSKGIKPDSIEDKCGTNYKPGLNDDADITRVRLDTLWQVSEDLINCVERLEEENIDSFTPDDLIDFFDSHGCGDVMVRWSDSQIKTSAQEGKIPQLDNWKELLAEKKIGLDSLMNLAGLNSFTTDQKAMDERVQQVWNRTEEKQ